MSATAENLRDLHELHQRAKAFATACVGPQDPGRPPGDPGQPPWPSWNRTAKALQDAKVQLKKHEHSLQGIDTKIDDLKTKLNLVKKNDEYKALQNQIAHEAAAKSKIEEEILVSLEDDRNQDRRVGKLEADAKRFGGEVAALQQQIDKQPSLRRPSSPSSRRRSSRPRIVIPEEYRVQYRRIVGAVRGRRAGRLRGWLVPWLFHVLTRRWSTT